MNKNLLSKLKDCISKYNSKEKHKKVLVILAIAVILGTCYLLMEPAITMEEELICFSESHEHVEDCYGTETEKEKVNYLVGLIDNLPTVKEMNKHIEELSDNETTEEEKVEYKDDIVGRAKDAYDYYLGLSTKLQNLITNIDKLLEYVDAGLIDLSDYVTTFASLDSYEQYGISAASSGDDAPTVVNAVSTSEFIELNLYDYGSNINAKYNGTNGNKEYPGFQWNGGAYFLKTTYDRHAVDFIDFGNSMITDFTYGSSSSGNNGKGTNAVKVGNSGGAINALDVSSYGVTNRPIGMSLNDSINDTSEDVLSRTLGSDGYPELSSETGLSDRSLSYLFSDGTYASKQNNASIDGLFQQNTTTGEYYYNSRENHAQYSNNRFTLYNQIITPNFIVYPFGNFLPFNDITSTNNVSQVGKISSIGNYVQQMINNLENSSGYSSNATKKQLVTMLQKYYDDLNSDSSASLSWSAKQAIVDYFTGEADNPSDDTSLITSALLNKMYNIDWDVNTNFFFGMEMKMNFMQPKGGITGNDNDQDGESDYPMEFYFTGDDDVWVYIDDVLFLDLSGIHRHVGGKIDFVNGVVYYHYLDSAGDGDVSLDAEDAYQSYTFEEILKAAGKSVDGLNSNGTFKDYTTHSFKFYYMERGSGSSVCRLNFNFPLLKQNSINVSKELSVDTGDADYLGNPDFKFQVLKANDDGSKPNTNTLFIVAGTEYTVYDVNDNFVRKGVTDSNGVFTLKAGQRAEFTGIEENSGKYYVRELLDDNITQYGDVTVSGETATTSLNVTVGSDTFTGLDSPVKDMSDGSTIFRFNNEIDTYKYGSLEITKVLEGDNVDSLFDFEVTLDGTKLPVGTKYTIGGTEKTVSVVGIISIKPGEVAIIDKILAGTVYEVEEVNLVANDYTVKYVVDDNEVDSIIGEIETETKVKVIVTNIANEGELNIPITKVIANPYVEDLVYSYEFKITEVDENLEEVESDNIVQDTITIEITSIVDGKDIVALNNGEFVIKYDRPNYSSEGRTYYYKIEEIPGDYKVTIYDDNYYILKVVVTKDSTGEFSAKVIEVYYNGMDDDHKITETEGGIVTNQFTFTNYLLTDLTISKEVHYNGDITQSFDFELQVTYDDEPIVGDYICEKGEVGILKQITFEEQGITTLGEEETTTTDECIITFSDDGITEISLLHNEYISIYGLPYNAVYKVTELTTDGYIVENQINSGNIYIGNEVNGTLVDDTDSDNTVKFINSSGYILPDTGSNGMLILIIIGALLFGIPVIYIGYTFYKRGRKVT